MSMDTIQLDRLELTEGDDYLAEYVVIDDDSNPVDMTGSTGSFDAKVNLDDLTSVWTMAMVVDGDQVTNIGKISFTGIVPAKFEGKYTIRLVISTKTNTLVTGGSDILVLKSAYVAP